MEIKKILWSTDGSEESEDAHRYVDAIARRYDSRVIALSVVEPPLFEWLDLSREIRGELDSSQGKLREKEVERIEKRIGALEFDGARYSVRVETGRPYEEIVRVAEEEGADLIAMGKRGLDLKGRILLGSTTNRVLRETKIPVLAVRRHERLRIDFDNILVPTDLTELSDEALDYALGLASAFNSKIYLLHVVAFHHSFEVASKGLAEDILGQLFERLSSKLSALTPDSTKGVEIEPKCLLSMRAWLGIVEFASEENIDLIVMSSHSRKGLSHFFLGSIAERVIGESPCPVIGLTP